MKKVIKMNRFMVSSINLIQLCSHVHLGRVEIRDEEVGVRVAVVDGNRIFHEEEGFVDGACLVHQSC